MTTRCIGRNIGREYGHPRFGKYGLLRCASVSYGGRNSAYRVSAGRRACHSLYVVLAREQRLWKTRCRAQPILVAQYILGGVLDR